MKRIILLGIALLFAFISFAQERFIRAGEAKKLYYVGSLPTSYIGSHHKLKIEIFGGGYIYTSLSTKTYSISARDGLRILCSQEGGGTGQYNLRVYKNDTKYDFVIESIWAYTSIAVKIWQTPNSGQGVALLQDVNISEYDSYGKEDVTNQFTQVLLPSSDMLGNLGIETLSPKSKLDVRGKIIADEVEVKVNKGADFVFSPDYKLKSLSEIETFVKENKHLPDIPSEKQMQENGLNLNEMQIKLLQKIEELTLYVIELKKENESLTERVKQLESK